MLQQPTLNALRKLNLHAMAAALEEQEQLPSIQDLPFAERLGLLWTGRFVPGFSAVCRVC